MYKIPELRVIFLDCRIGPCSTNSQVQQECIPVGCTACFNCYLEGCLPLGLGMYPYADTPTGQTLPWADTPQKTPPWIDTPWIDTPLDRHPWADHSWQAPLGRHSPLPRHSLPGQTPPGQANLQDTTRQKHLPKADTPW